MTVEITWRAGEPGRPGTLEFTGTQNQAPVFGPGRLRIDPENLAPDTTVVDVVEEVDGREMQFTCVATNETLAEWVDSGVCVGDKPTDSTGSDFEIVVDSATVRPGEPVQFSIVTAFGQDASASDFLDWECWDGEAWLPVFQIARDSLGQPAPPVSVDPFTLPTVFGQREVPDSWTIVVPDVGDGIYRLHDRVWIFDGNEVTQLDGFQLIEVRS